jgi:hypothetical protein
MVSLRDGKFNCTYGLKPGNMVSVMVKGNVFILMVLFIEENERMRKGGLRLSRWCMV